MPTFKIQHITRYNYEGAVRDSANQIMLYPINDERQDVMLHKLDVTGNPLIETHYDIFENKVGTFTHSQPHQQLVINSMVEVRTKSVDLPLRNANSDEQWQALHALRLQFPFIEFLRNRSFSHASELDDIIREIKTENEPPLISAEKFCAWVFEKFTYKKGVTTVDTTLDEIWNLKSGVCQDFAHILLAMLKLVNIPGRYVSGYICPNRDGMRGEGATHAWVEAYIPDYGWLGLDPTNNCVTNENHVRLAVGKNYYDCSPVRGTYRGTSGHTLDVSVTVSSEATQHVAEKQVEVNGTKTTAQNSFRRHIEIQMQQQQ